MSWYLYLRRIWRRGSGVRMSLTLLLVIALTAASSGEKENYVEEQWRAVIDTGYRQLEKDKLDLAYKEARYLSSVLEVFSMKYGWLPGKVGEFAPWSEVVQRDLGANDSVEKLLRSARDPWGQDFFYGRLSEEYIIVSRGIDLEFDEPYADLVEAGVEDGAAYCNMTRRTEEADVVYQSGFVCPRGLQSHQ